MATTSPTPRPPMPLQKPRTPTINATVVLEEAAGVPFSLLLCPDAGRGRRRSQRFSVRHCSVPARPAPPLASNATTPTGTSGSSTPPVTHPGGTTGRSSRHRRRSGNQPARKGAPLRIMLSHYIYKICERQSCPNKPHAESHHPKAINYSSERQQNNTTENEILQIYATTPRTPCGVATALGVAYPSLPPRLPPKEVPPPLTN